MGVAIIKMLKKNKKIIIIVAIVAILSIVAGIFVGKGLKNNEEDKSIEKPSTSFILNIDGINYEITDSVKSYEAGCVMVDGSVVTEYLGFSTTVDKEKNTVNYSKNLDSFTFFPGDKKYVYNDVVVNSRKECEQDGDVYYINVVSLLVDMELDVSQSDNTIFVKGFYQKSDISNGHTSINNDSVDTNVDE